MVSNTVAVDAITFSIFISYWWKIFGNRHIRGESRVCHMHVHITRCIHLHHKLTKNWCITNTLLSANQRILSVADIIAYSFKKCTVCKSVPKELFSSFLQMIEKRALFDYVILHVNICHILNKFKHIFFISLLKNICTANNAGYIRILPAVVYFNSHTRSACHVARRLLRHVNFEWKNKICDTFKLWYIYPQNDPSSLQMTLVVSFFIAKCL